MITPYCTKNLTDFHPFLKEIPQPPKQLWVYGTLPDTNKKHICIVGSRKCTRYGLDAVEKIISSLDKNIVIVSGMAIGIDTAVHEAAMNYGLTTIAFPGSGLDPSVLYPKQNRSLAEKITGHGCLISEYEPTVSAQPWMFVRRNRLMAGISHITIVVEASEKSGTLVTARMALDYNRDVGAVPGSIFSQNSSGPNRLIHEGAHTIREASDIHELLGMNTQATLALPKSYDDCTPDELCIIRSLEFLGECNRETLILHSGLSISLFNRALTLLEIKSYIVSRGQSLSLTL